MAVVMNPRKGYFGGVMSGITWGLDAVMLGVVMVMAPFVRLSPQPSKDSPL